jgi:hypothetical protein
MADVRAGAEQIQGQTANGSAVQGNPVLVGGSDGTNARSLSTTAGGVLKVDLSATTANATAVKTDGSAVTQPISAPALTKGTQAANGFSVQDLKDAGRTLVTFFVDAAAFVTTEALTAAIAVNKGGTVTSAQTTYTVTSGKTLRIQSILITYVVGGTTIANLAKIRLRAVTSGTALVSSGIVWGAALPCPTGTGANGEGVCLSANFPDGLELPSGWNFGISHVMPTAASGSWTMSITGYEY